jgi:hypothetical protein
MSFRDGRFPCLSFSVPSTQHVRIEIINASGRIVAVPVNTVMKAGRYRVSLCANGPQPVKGLYCARMRIGNMALRTMVLVIQ